MVTLFTYGFIAGFATFVIFRLALEKRRERLELEKEKELTKTPPKKPPAEKYGKGLEKLPTIKLNPPKDVQDAYYDNEEVFITFRKRDMFPFGNESHMPKPSPSSLSFSMEQAEKYKAMGKSLGGGNTPELDFPTMRMYPFEFVRVLDSGEINVYSKVEGKYVSEIKRRVYNDPWREDLMYYLPDGTLFFKIKTKAKTP